MNLSKAAQKWGVSRKEAKRLCDEGMVPEADPIIGAFGQDYDIPDDIPKPPCNRKNAVLMLENINLIKEEDAKPWVRGYSYEEIDNCYNFFLECGFIAGYVSPTLIEGDRNHNRMVIFNALKECTIITRGKQLIARENEKKESLHVDEINAGASVTTGPIEMHGDVKLKR